MHEGPAVEEGVDTMAAHRANFVGGEDAGFGDGNAHLNPLSRQGRGGKKPGQQIERGLQADFEGAQVAVVDVLQRVGEIDI